MRDRGSVDKWKRKGEDERQWKDSNWWHKRDERE